MLPKPIVEVLHELAESEQRFGIELDRAPSKYELAEARARANAVYRACEKRIERELTAEKERIRKASEQVVEWWDRHDFTNDEQRVNDIMQRRIVALKAALEHENSGRGVANG